MHILSLVTQTDSMLFTNSLNEQTPLTKQLDTF